MTEEKNSKSESKEQLPTNRKNPFSQEILNDIFKVSSKYPDRLNSRESSWLEFKEKFGFGSLSKYAKTMAAFANTHGGYIVFGIKNKPHKMTGLNEEEFNDIDPEKLTRGLNEIFSPEIEWDANVHEYKGKTFGLIYTFESQNKPVVARKNSGEVKEAEVYYRYRGRSEKIKYSELIATLDDRRRQEQQRWMKLLENIAKVGVENASIFDINSGEITGRGATFVIDESILPEIKATKEGQFVEKDGMPTLKLMGKIHRMGEVSVLPTKKIYSTRTKGIRTDDIICDFLNSQIVDNPIEYIKQICWEASANLPVYHYISQANKSLNEIMFIIEKVRSRSPVQGRLLDRLNDSRDFSITIPATGSRAAKQKAYYRQQLLNKSVDINLPYIELRYLVQSFRTLTKKELNKKYALELLKQLFETYYTQRTHDLSGELRYSICHIDILLNRI